jgi:hypothetical protein
MPNTQSIYTTRLGEFRAIYRELKRHPELRARTPVVFCEGDSWFSTPASMNILDWLVFPTPDAEERGVPILGQGGLFFRAEESGDLATNMFTARRLKDLMDWYGAVDFDIALLSAGGNDLVGKFLKKAFAGKGTMTVPQAIAVVEKTGRFHDVYTAYERALTAMVKLRPATPIVGHSYCYPLKMGTPADLTLVNVGLVALLKKNAGPWIGPHVGKALPALADQRLFARRMIDTFVERVLQPLAVDPRFRDNFRWLDLREMAPAEDDWFDEMHPRGAVFKRLSEPFAREIAKLFVLR